MPSTEIEPDVASTKRKNERASVDFPQPWREIKEEGLSQLNTLGSSRRRDRMNGRTVGPEGEGRRRESASRRVEMRREKWERSGLTDDSDLLSRLDVK